MDRPIIDMQISETILGGYREPYPPGGIWVIINDSSKYTLEQIRFAGYKNQIFFFDFDGNEYNSLKWNCKFHPQ